MVKTFSGLIAAPPTPMHDDGRLDLDRVGPLVDLLAANGLAGAFVCGTTGEGVSLTREERTSVVEAFRDEAADEFRIFVHVGHASAAEAAALARHAESAGADAVAVAVTPPTYFKPASLDHLVDFLAEIAAAADLPMFYYHIPSLTGVTIQVADLLAVAAQRGVPLAGAKFTSEDLADFRRCVTAEEGRYEMLFGRDEILLAGLAMGASGAVGTTYNFAAPLYHQLVAAFEAGDLDAARAAQDRAIAMIAAFHDAGGGVPATKAIMGLIGVDCGPVRPPLRPLTDHQTAELRRRLDEIGFFDFCCRRA